MKIGILGGSFDPLHFGHIALAQTAQTTLNLDKVLFLPSGNHPLKGNKTVLNAKQRLDLVKKVLQKYPVFEASALDMQHTDKSYTYELIKRLQKNYPQADLFMIVGDDIVEELPKWFKWKWLLENVKFIVAARPDTNRQNWHNLAYLENFNFIKMPPHDISSTQIRQMVKNNLDITGLVPEIILTEVKKYYK